MAKTHFYKTVEGLTKAIDSFILENKFYTRNEFIKGMGFASHVSIINTKKRKGFENVFDRCVFCKDRRDKYAVAKKNEIKMSNEPEIKKYADSIQPEIEAYCKARRKTGLIRRGIL